MDVANVSRRLRRQCVISPGSVGVATELAWLSCERDAKFATSWARRALACDPLLSQSLVNFAEVQIATGAASEGIVSLRRAIALDPFQWSAWHSLSAGTALLGSGAEALCFQRRAHILGAPREHVFQLISLEALYGDPVAASRHLADVLREDPTPDAAIRIALLALQSGSAAAGVKLYETLVEHCPPSEDAAMVRLRARIMLMRSTSEIRATLTKWGTTAKDIYHPIDVERRLVGPGYLIIRGFSCGFWGEVIHVAINVALAEIMGRVPLVYWGQEVRYRTRGDGNTWDLFFEPLSDVELSSLVVAEKDVYPGHWNPSSIYSSEHLQNLKLLWLNKEAGNRHGISAIAALNRGEAVVVSDGWEEMRDVLAWAAPGHRWAHADPLTVYREVFCRSFRPRQHIAKSIERIASELFGETPTVAVHVRGQSQAKNVESMEKSGTFPSAYFVHIDRWLAQDPGYKLFILTDIDDALIAFRKRYGRRVLSLDRMRSLEPNFGRSGIELPQVSEVGFNMALDGYQLGLEVLIDAYLAAACDRFVGDGASAVSCSIINLKKWRSEDIALVRKNVFLERSVSGRR